MKHLITLLLLLLNVVVLSAQISQPPSGDNQKAAVTQYMGLVSVTIKYSSPDVHGPNGEDRKGKIWGQLVPYGLSNLDYGWSNETNKSPWRAGANENTVIEFSNDVTVEGKSLPAGKYGLHMIPNPDEWVIIFSKNTSSWGSYFYKASEDALRVNVKPLTSPYTEWLTYEFDDRQPNSCVARLRWENLAVQFKIAVPNGDMLYVEKMRDELRGVGGQTDYMTAAQFCAERKINLPEALQWADQAISMPYIGVKNYTSLATKAQVLTAMGKNDEAAVVMKEAVSQPTATMQDVHVYARTLLAMKKPAEALQIFKLNAERNPGQFMTLFGLARGYSANGDFKNALVNAQLALPKAGTDQEKKAVSDAIAKLKEGKDFN
jgi:tetratricopeptide (TPR) repeat protein